MVGAVVVLTRSLIKERRRTSAPISHDDVRTLRVKQEGMSEDLLRMRQDFERANERLQSNERMFYTHLSESRADSKRLSEVLERLSTIERQLLRSAGGE